MDTTTDESWLVAKLRKLLFWNMIGLWSWPPRQKKVVAPKIIVEDIIVLAKNIKNVNFYFFFNDVLIDKVAKETICACKFISFTQWISLFSLFKER